MDLPRNSDLKPGPGLLTGKEGEFVIYGGKDRVQPPRPSTPPG